MAFGDSGHTVVSRVLLELSTNPNISGKVFKCFTHKSVEKKNQDENEKNNGCKRSRRVWLVDEMWLRVKRYAIV